MAIKSTKDLSKNENQRMVGGIENENDSKNDSKLRPKLLDDYVWQEAIKKHLKVSIGSAKIRNAPLEHILLYGPPWLWKTTLSLIIAQEMWVNMKHTSGPAIEKQSDIISILTSLEQWDVLFIDEIHRLKPQIEEVLYSAMEDFSIDIMIWSGAWATSIKMDLPKFTLIWATTKLSMLSSPLRDRFWNILKLDFYEGSDLESIAKRSFDILQCEISWKITCEAIASKSRWTPRIVNRFVKIIRDYKTVWSDVETAKWVANIFQMLWVDSAWLDQLDRKILLNLYDTFSGKPVWLHTLASVVWEEEDTIEDVVEPYLLKVGFLERTARWRQITELWKKHIDSTRQL